MSSPFPLFFLLLLQPFPSEQVSLYCLLSVAGRVADLGESGVHLLQEAVLRSRCELYEIAANNARVFKNSLPIPLTLWPHIGMILVQIGRQWRAATLPGRKETDLSKSL